MQHDEFVIPGGFRYSLLHFQVVEQAFLKGKRNLGRVIRMTEREKEIIALIVDRVSNKQIAGRLKISVFTVKSHIHNILEKLA
jgi:ATP/maltotriose-dependent transcriptional regulator MalT